LYLRNRALRENLLKNRLPKKNLSNAVCFDDMRHMNPLVRLT
jgi:hypothetical protein